MNEQRERRPAGGGAPRITTQDLKPATITLLNARNDLHFSYGEDGLNLWWEEIEADAEFLVGVFKSLLSQTEVATMESSTTDVVETLRLLSVAVDDAQVLALSFMRALHDFGILVTQGHTGVTPFTHTKEVVDTLTISSAMRHKEAVVLVFAAFLHDVGKGLSATVTHRNELMKLSNQTKHWHPDHEEVSVLFASALFKTKKLQAFFAEKKLTTADQNVLLRLIKYHHGFEKVLVVEDRLVAAEGGEESLEMLRSLPFAEVVLLFYLAFADMCSTAAYRQFWPQKIAFFHAWLAERDETSEDPYWWQLAQDALKLSPQKAGLQEQEC